MLCLPAPSRRLCRAPIPRNAGRGVAMRRCGRRSSGSMPVPSPTGYRAFRHGSAPPCVTAPRGTVSRGQPRMRRFLLRLRQNPRRATVPALRPVVRLPPADRLVPDVCRNAGTDGMFSSAAFIVHSRFACAAYSTTDIVCARLRPVASAKNHPRPSGCICRFPYTQFRCTAAPRPRATTTP